MTQRNRRATVEEGLRMARRQLELDFSSLDLLQQQIPIMTPQQSCGLILDIFTNKSRTLLGTLLIKQKVASLHHPYQPQIDMILEKAELLYLESFAQDLEHLKNQERVAHVNPEEVKQYIEEMNWKLGYNYNRQSFLNESQEVGDNIDLMKFFEGVRNYHHQQENLQRTCLEKLKSLAHQTEKNLTFKKGYLISRLESMFTGSERDKKKSAFQIFKQVSQRQKKVLKILKIQNRRISQTFQIIKQYSKSSRNNLIDKKIKRFVDRKLIKEMVHVMKNIKKFDQKLSILQYRVRKLVQQKRRNYGNQLFKKINTKMYSTFLNKQEGIKILCNWIKKRIYQTIWQNLGASVIKFQTIFNKKYTKTLKQAFHSFQQFSQKEPEKIDISNKFKARLLLALQKHDEKPINLRKTFLDWYLKSHEQKYAKKVYNILLQAKISKFTFFMRMKDMIDRERKYKIRKQMKIFLIVLGQKMGKYYKQKQKGFIYKWRNATSRYKKIENMFQFISKLQEDVNQKRLHQGLNMIKEQSKDRSYLQKFFNKWIGRYSGNLKRSLDLMKTMPNKNKSEAKTKLKNWVSDKILLKAEKQRRFLFQILKSNYEKGLEIKMKVVRKAFNHDDVQKQKFIGYWNFNVKLEKQKQQFTQREQNFRKKTAISILEGKIKQLKKNQTKFVLQVFKEKSQLSQRTKKLAKKLFSRILVDETLQKLEDVFSCFKDEHQRAKTIKEKLVKKLVTANKLKQAQILCILKTRTFDLYNEEKKDRSIKLFEHLFQVMRENNSQLFEKNSKFSILSKMLIIRTINIQQSFHQICSLPQRINWKKRENAVKFLQKIDNIIKTEQNTLFGKFKYAHNLGRFKMKKAMDIMAYKYLDVTKNNFNKYRKVVATLKQNEKNKSISNFFSNLYQLNKSQLEMIFMDESLWKKKSEYLKKFNQKVQGRMGQAFKLWHQTAKAMSFFNDLKNQKKKRYIQILSKTLNHSKFMETKKVIERFKKNASIKKIQLRFLRKLCDSQAGKVAKALMIWKNLPQQQNKELISRATKFEGRLSKFGFQILKMSFQVFKNHHYFGNEKKKFAIRKLVQKSCTGIEKYFQIWKKNNSMITLFSKCHKLEGIFERINIIESQSLKLLFHGNQTENMKSGITILRNLFRSKSQEVFGKWIAFTINKRAEEDKKKLNLLKLFQVNSKNQQNQIHTTINKLKMNHLVKLQQKKMKIVSRLRQAIKISCSYERQDKNKIFQIFRSNRYQGNFKKSKAFEKFLRQKIGQTHKCLSIWNELSNKSKDEEKRRLIGNSFQSLHDMCRANLSALLSSQKQLMIKKKALDQLYQVQQIKFRGYFNLWRERVKEMQISEVLNNQSKRTILEKINRMASSKSEQTIKKSIKMFYLNFKIQRVQKKFIQRLLQTKSGKVIEAFNKWKKIPNRNLKQNYKKVQKFYFKLQGFARKILKGSLKPFSSDRQEGNALKKGSVINLLNTTSTGTKKFYHRWLRITKRDLTLHQVTSIMKWMDSLNHQTGQMLKILFQDKRSYRIKTRAIKKLIKSSRMSVGLYFGKWREHSKQMKIQEIFKNEKKTVALKFFNNVIHKSEHGNILRMIQKFKKNVAISKISKNFFNKLLQTKSGKVVRLFEIWKSIPDIKIAKKKKQAIKFESRLHKMTLKFIKSAFDPFKNDSYEGSNKKKHCISKLIAASMSEEKKKFLLWRQIIREQKVLNHSKLLESTFSYLENVIKNQTEILIKQSGKQIEKKKWLCRKLIDNSNFVQHHSYLMWKQAYKQDNVKIEKEEGRVKMFLKDMFNIHEKISNRSILKAVDAFKKKKESLTQASQKIIKEKKNRMAIKFYERITQYIQIKKGFFLQIMKEDSQVVFFLEKTKKLDEVFKNTELVIKQNLNTFLRPNREIQIMENALKKIFNNFSLSTEKAFNIWRQHKNIMNLQNKVNAEKKRDMISLLTNILKNQESIKVPAIIKRFNQNYRLIKRQKDILNKILHCKAGKVPLAFMIWKSLPQPISKKLKQKAIKFENGLVTIHFKVLKKSFSAFYDAYERGNIKKRQVGRKIVLLTMSDSNRTFNIWRKNVNQMKLAERILQMDNSFNLIFRTFEENLIIFNYGVMDNIKKSNSLKKLVRAGNKNLSEIIMIWRNKAKEIKKMILAKALLNVEPDKLNGILLKQTFELIKKKRDIEVMRISINSLWKWKLSNLQASYYSKFIKVFKQSEQLIILSTILNKKLYQNMHHSFRAINLVSSNRQNRKAQITEKYLLRKLSNYFQIFKYSVYQGEVKNWKKRYTGTVKGEKMIEIFKHILQRVNLDLFDSIIRRNNQIKKSLQLQEKLENHLLSFKRCGFSKIKKSPFYNFTQIVQDVQNSVKLNNKRYAFNQLKLLFKLQNFTAIIQKKITKLAYKNGFSKILARSELRKSQKVALLLMSTLQNHSSKVKVKSVIENLKLAPTKLKSMKKICKILTHKQSQNTSQFYYIARQQAQKEILLQRSRKGLVLKKILAQQDKKILRNTLRRMRKKENPWVKKFIKKLALNSNIKQASNAVSFWRMKMFQKSLQHHD